MTLIVGVTGGIGCGKTTVTDLLAARGAAVRPPPANEWRRSYEFTR